MINEELLSHYVINDFLVESVSIIFLKIRFDPTGIQQVTKRHYYRRRRKRHNVMLATTHSLIFYIELTRGLQVLYRCFPTPTLLHGAAPALANTPKLMHETIRYQCLFFFH